MAHGAGGGGMGVASGEMGFPKQCRSCRTGPGALEHLPDRALALADELVEQLGPLDRDEVGVRAVGDRFGQQGLAAAGRAVQQHPRRLRDPHAPAQLRVHQRQPGAPNWTQRSQTYGNQHGMAGSALKITLAGSVVTTPVEASKEMRVKNMSKS